MEGKSFICDMNCGQFDLSWLYWSLDFKVNFHKMVFQLHPIAPHKSLHFWRLSLPEIELLTHLTLITFQILITWTRWSRDEEMGVGWYYNIRTRLERHAPWNRSRVFFLNALFTKMGFLDRRAVTWERLDSWASQKKEKIYWIRTPNLLQKLEQGIMLLPCLAGTQTIPTGIFLLFLGLSRQITEIVPQLTSWPLPSTSSCHSML
jgi:hypothetical protein